MNELQHKIVEIMTVFDAFCKEQRLTYYMLGGTMLGAYRHKGFIPWDDDMDIGLPRRDYERLLAMPKHRLPEGYALRSHRKEKGIPYTFAHFEDKGTTYIEQRRDKEHYAGGVYLEIFPLDGCPDARWRQRLMDLRVRYYKRILYGLILDYGQKPRTFLRAAVIHGIRALFTMDRVTQKLDSYLAASGKKGKRYLCNPLGHWGIRENIPRHVFGTPVPYLFEGRKFLGPEQPERYLECLYGKDFMVPPSKDEQEKGKHPAYVCDLNLPYEEYQRKKGKH